MNQLATYSSNGATLAYREAGHGTTLLLVHAFPLNSAMWDAQVSELSKRYRVIAPDLRGFGASQLGATPASLDQYADDLAALLDHLGLERAALAGLSMGGYIAFAFLRRHRARLSALILADTRATPDTDEARQGRETNAQLAEREGAQAVGEAMLPKLLSPHASDALRATAREIIAANSGAGVAAALRCMAVRPDSTGLLDTINFPTLVLVGAEDAVTPPNDARRLHAGIANSRLVEIAGAGHLANLEQPAAFNQAISEFL